MPKKPESKPMLNDVCNITNESITKQVPPRGSFLLRFRLVSSELNPTNAKIERYAPIIENENSRRYISEYGKERE